MSRTFLIRYVFYHPEIPLGPVDVTTPLGVRMLEYPVLIQASSVGTLALELGLLPAALLGISITPFLLGIYGMTTGIWLTLGILFGDVYFFVAMFFTGDGLHERLARDRDLDLVFDERCSFCARSLYPPKLLDVNDTVTFYTQSDVPERYRDRETVEFEEAMYVFDDDRGYEGHYALRELLDQFGIFRPLVLLMGFTPVERLGTRIYRYVATTGAGTSSAASTPPGDAVGRNSPNVAAQPRHDTVPSLWSTVYLGASEPTGDSRTRLRRSRPRYSPVSDPSTSTEARADNRIIPWPPAMSDGSSNGSGHPIEVV